MALVSTKELLSKAKEGGYAVGAFNVCNLETIQGVVWAAEKLKSPAILQLWSGFLRNELVSAETIAAIVKSECSSLKADVALHLDHGESMGETMQAMEAGYSSVMIDASSCSFEDNWKRTRSVSFDAHAKGIAVEAELGHVAGAEGEGACGDSGHYTDPSKVDEFIEKSGADFLAIAVGTAHGSYTVTPELDYERIESIRERIDVPLVLHGASYTPDEQIREAIRCGIAKINVATELNQAYREACQEFLKKEAGAIWPLEIGQKGAQAFQAKVEEKMMLFSSNNRC